jgi:hypothetical protein
MMPNESRRTKRLLSVLYGSYATFAEAEKQKRNQYKHNPEAWILIESYNNETYSYRIGFFSCKTFLLLIQTRFVHSGFFQENFDRVFPLTH